MRSCCVPGCGNRQNLHSVPFTKKLKWKHWLKLCPFFLKYTFKQLDHVKICRKHFIPEHIDFEKGRLKNDSFPLLHLPALKTIETVNKNSKILEINPIEPNVRVNFKVVAPTSSPVETDNAIKGPSTEGTIEKRKEPYQVYIKFTAKDTQALPVDHNKYCLPSRADETPACLSSGKLVSSDNTAVIIKAEPGAPVDYNEDCATPPPDNISDCIHFIQQERLEDAATKSSVSVASQTDAVSKHLHTQLSEQLPDYTADTISLDSSDFDDNVEYILPTDIVADKPAHTNSQEESTLCISQNVLNLLASNFTLESIHASFLRPNDQSHVPSKCSQAKKIPPENHAELNNQSKLNIQPTAMKHTAGVIQQLQSKPAPKPTLESLVAELTESVSAEDMAELQPSPAVMTTNTLTSLLNPTCHPTKRPLVRNHPSIRVCLDKENSTPNEIKLRMQNNMLKRKLKATNQRLKNLKLKLDGILAIAKPFIKAYPKLKPETRALIDTQIRLAGVERKAARYNEEEKLFALRLHQISPDCYRFLQQYLKLPSKNTMQVIVKNA